jgi:hypothetical protein
MTTYPRGEDWASYQPSAPSTAGLDFAIVKATEGTWYINPRHAAQAAHGREAHLVVGHYHFVRSGSTMRDQADYFLHTAGARPGDILTLDWEDHAVPYQEKDAWLHYVIGKAPHCRVLLYCNRDFWLHRDHSSFAGDGLWIADPGAPAGKPRVDHRWVIHQYSEAGGVDRDLANFKDTASMRAWAAKGTPPAPEPALRFEPYPGAAWFTIGRRSPVVAATHERLVAVGCARYRSHTHLDVIGSGDIASYEAWQRAYNAQHHKGWTGDALKWPPGRETWDALHVPATNRTA